MPIGEESQTKTHPGHSRCHKWSLLLCTHSLHLYKMFTFKCQNSFLETEHETLHSGLQCKASKDFWRECSNLASISSTFTSVNTWCFESLYLSNNDHVCINLFMTEWTAFSTWNCNILKFMPESSPYFLCGYSTNTLISMQNSHMPLWHKT
jgi:hypothetical protein